MGIVSPYQTAIQGYQNLANLFQGVPTLPGFPGDLGNTNISVGTQVVNGSRIGLQGGGPTGPQSTSDPTNYINADPDPRLNDIVARTQPNLRRGIIQQDYSLVSGDQKYPYACQFMFNPGEVDVGYAVAPNITPQGNLTPAQLAATAIYPGSTTIQFQLLFDRTYEVQYPLRNGAKNVKGVGVYEDIGILESITGVRDNIQQTTVTAADGSTKTVGGATATGSGAEQGNMLFVPVYVIFGGGVQGSGLAYYGYITALTVSYAMWSANMVPTRAGVQVSMTTIVGNNLNDFNNSGVPLVSSIALTRTTTTSGKH